MYICYLLLKIIALIKIPRDHTKRIVFGSKPDIIIHEKSNVLNILNVQKREIDLNSNKGNANEWEIWGIRKVLTYFVVHSTKQ